MQWCELVHCNVSQWFLNSRWGRDLNWILQPVNKEIGIWIFLRLNGMEPRWFQWMKLLPVDNYVCMIMYASEGMIDEYIIPEST